MNLGHQIEVLASLLNKSVVATGRENTNKCDVVRRDAKLLHFEYMVISELAMLSLSKNPVLITEACMLAPRAHDSIHADACNAVA
jgi:hypothetical protein